MEKEIWVSLKLNFPNNHKVLSHDKGMAGKLRTSALLGGVMLFFESHARHPLVIAFATINISSHLSCDAS